MLRFVEIESAQSYPETRAPCRAFFPATPRKIFRDAYSISKHAIEPSARCDRGTAYTLSAICCRTVTMTRYSKLGFAVQLRCGAGLAASVSIVLPRLIR